jgi:2-amino-4-hydroxy-6-hydroxymethyldihydropteridine diphosphokinase
VSDNQHQAAIGMGSNLGDRAANLLRGITGLIQAGLPLVACSAIYETAAVDYLDQPAFLNLVVLIKGKTLPSPTELLSICLSIETACGRTRTVWRGPRTLDLDLLCYDDIVVTPESSSPALILPHPRLHERQFVLAPLNELIPDELHPVQQISYRDLLIRLPATAAIQIYQA